MVEVVLAWLLTSRAARRITAITLGVYACAAVISGSLLIDLGVTRAPIVRLTDLAPVFVLSIFPGFLVALAWGQGRATSDRQPPQTWWWPSKAGRAEEFPLYVFGKAMPTPLKALEVTLLATVAVSALLTFAVLTFSTNTAPLAAHTPPALCGYHFSDHGAVICITAAQESAVQATFPVVTLGFDLVICTICAGGLLEQRSRLGRALRHPHPATT